MYIAAITTNERLDLLHYGRYTSYTSHICIILLLCRRDDVSSALLCYELCDLRDNVTTGIAQFYARRLRSELTSRERGKFFHIFFVVVLLLIIIVIIVIFFFFSEGRQSVCDTLSAFHVRVRT